MSTRKVPFLVLKLESVSSPNIGMRKNSSDNGPLRAHPAHPTPALESALSHSGRSHLPTPRRANKAKPQHPHLATPGRNINPKAQRSHLPNTPTKRTYPPSPTCPLNANPRGPHNRRKQAPTPLLPKHLAPLPLGPSPLPLTPRYPLPLSPPTQTPRALPTWDPIDPTPNPHRTPRLLTREPNLQLARDSSCNELGKA